MDISGGIRFLPVFGSSGSGKTSAALEVGTHLPQVLVDRLPREAIESPEKLDEALRVMERRAKGRRIVAVIDQYEEVSAQKTAIPSTFVETLSLLDRRRDAPQALFIWLTTSRTFQADLVEATSRNKRILLSPDFEIESLAKSEWPAVIEETFRFHNQERTLSDYEILDVDLEEISEQENTIGSAIEATGERLAKYATALHDLSTYMVVMLWPVTDGLRITRIQQFSDPRQGYKLDWNAWYRQLNADDQQQLPVREFNRARLYFDVRLVPIAAADLHPLCKELESDEYAPGKSYLERFQNTHFYTVVSGNWNADAYAPLRERESKRAAEAREWYESVTHQPTLLGKRIAKCLNMLEISASYEKTISSSHGKVRADVAIDRAPVSPPNVLVEMKAYSPENTMPSTICQAIATTLKRHAQFAGFLQRQ